MRRASKLTILSIVVLAAVLLFVLAPIDYWLVISYLGESGGVYRSLGCATVGVGTTYVAVNTDEFGFTPPGIHWGCNSPLHLPP